MSSSFQQEQNMMMAADAIVPAEDQQQQQQQQQDNHEADEVDAAAGARAQAQQHQWSKQSTSSLLSSGTTVPKMINVSYNDDHSTVITHSSTHDDGDDGTQTHNSSTTDNIFNNLDGSNRSAFSTSDSNNERQRRRQQVHPSLKRNRSSEKKNNPQQRTSFSAASGEFFVDDFLSLSSKPNRNSRKSNKHIQQLTINTLRYDRVGLVGRENEIQILHDCLERIMTDDPSHLQEGERDLVDPKTLINNKGYSSGSINKVQRIINNRRKKELVFIKGFSGVGKSTLANSLEKSILRYHKNKNKNSKQGSSSNNKNNLQQQGNQTKKDGNDGGGVYLRGKFDLNNRDEPYSGIASAFAEICRAIKTASSSQQQRSSTTATSEVTTLSNNIGRDIMTELGSEARLLVNLIPELESILPADSRRRRSSLMFHHQGTTTTKEQNFEEQQERWKYSFRVLTRVLSSYFTPMVIFLDDLQWADPPSLEVIDMLISDTQNINPLMIIGGYRSNEVPDGHILTSKMNDLELKKSKFQFNTTHIQLESFGVDDVNQIIMALLSIDDVESTQWLAEICYKRTAGNPFFLIQFVATLEEQELITFNLGLLKWQWDQVAIENLTIPTANVVGLLQARMRKLPEEIQLLLQYAACLGSSFNSQTLELLWQKHALPNSATATTIKSSTTSTSTSKTTTGTTDDDDAGGEPAKASTNLSDLLDVLIEGNYIEICATTQRHSNRSIFDVEYRWVHDKVQEAALLLGRAAEDSFQFQIGLLLYDSLEERELEDVLFDVVYLINRGDDENRRIDIITLNLRAAEKAQRCSAFHSAAVYVSHGINLLPDDKWTSAHRELTLRLYTLGAEMEMAVGRHEVMERYNNEVLEQTDLSTLERLPIYITQFQKLCDVDGKYDDTINLCIAVLKELGCPIPKGAMLPIKAISGLFRTVKKAKKTSKIVYETPQVMTDPTHTAIMLFLSRLFYASYHARKNLLRVVATCKMIQMTLKFGVCSVSGQAYACLGLLTTSILGDFGTGSFFAETGLLIQKMVGSMYTESVTNFVCYYGPLPWTNPIQSYQSTPFLEGYVAGMRSGNTEYAMWNALHHLVITPYQLGKPLSTMESECARIISQVEDLKQSDHGTITKMYQQLFLNLMGWSNETVVLKGDAFNSEKFEPRSALLTGISQYMHFQLYYIFGMWEEAAEMALQKRGFGATPGSVAFMFQTCQRGVVLYAMALRTKKRIYKKSANQIRKTIEKWMKKGNPNVQHFHSFLCAEQAAVNGKSFNAETLYKGAIQLAARAGHLNDAALFNERYADFLLHTSESAHAEDEAKYRIEQAIHFYKEWEANAKVEILQDNLRMGIRTTT